MPRILARKQVERHVLVIPGARQMRDCKPRALFLGDNFLERIVEFLARHEKSELFVVHLTRWKSTETFAIAQHRHPLGDLEHFVEPMTYKNRTDALFLQLADHALKRGHLLAGQRSGGLIHDHEPGLR